MRQWAVGLAALASSLLCIMPAQAADYPNKPIEVIASQGPGGLSDIFMRTVAQELGPALHQSVVVENRTGAGGSIGARACGSAPPDGYTLCILPSEAMLTNPVTHPISGFDPKDKLVPITRLFYLTQVFAVTASLNVKTFDELIKLTKAKPKTMSYMAPSLAKVAFMEHLNKTYGTDFVRIPFKGGGDAVNSMLSGTTPIAIFGIGNLIQLMRAGKIVGLTVDGGGGRSPLAPEIPTFKEVGFAVQTMPTFFGLYAPTGTPKPVIERLYTEVKKLVGRPDFQKKYMETRGLQAVLTPPDQFAKELVQERVEAREVVKASGLYPKVK